MSFISNMVNGLLGGSKGSNFQAKAAPIIQGFDTNQISNAYGNAQNNLGQQQAFVNALNAQNGLGNQSSVFNQQQNLANQFQNVANGVGPNPALQQFQNTTGQNVANQAALMAGQRGAGANAGLLARQIGQQGANIQQQAVGQGAALQAQQQLSAMNALQQQQGMMGNLANQQVGQQASGLQGLNQFGQNEQQALLSALGNYNQAQVGSTGSQNSANAGIAAQNAKTQGGLLGGGLAALGTSLLMPGLGAAGTALGALGAANKAGSEFTNSYTPNSSSFHLASGGQVPGPVSGVGKFLMSKGGAINMKNGASVPGVASVKGDSLKNDTVPAMLSPGEVVIPRSVMQSEDPISNSAKFVSAVMSKKNGGRK